MASDEKGTIVLITGANSGIGYATSKVIASASPDYHIVMCARSESKGKAAVEELQTDPSIKGQLSFVRLDVTDSSSIEAAAREVDQRFGRVDVLINNAGIAEAANEAFTVEKMNKIFSVNCTGPAIVSQAFKPLLAKSRQPHPYSIFVSSSLGSLTLAAETGGRLRMAMFTMYRMSKAALNMLTIQEAREYLDEGKGPKVFAVCPGFVRSYLRGTSEEAVSGGGRAGDPEVSGQTILSIIEGKRDEDVGRFVHKDGVYPW